MDLDYLNKLISTAGRMEALREVGTSDLSLQKFELSKEKHDLAQKQFMFNQYKTEVDKAKYTMSTLTDLYGQTKSLAMKNHIRDTMSNFYGTTDPVLRQALEPFIRHSPISKLQQKALDYDRLYGKILEPVLEKEDKDYVNYTRAWFRTEDAKNQRNYYITGKSSEKAFTVSLPEGFIGVRGEKGKVSVLSPEQQELEKVSEATGVPMREIITGGGWVKSGQEYLVRENGQEASLQNEVNLFTQKARTITKKLKDIEIEGLEAPEPLPTELKKMLGNVVSSNFKNNPLAEKMYELANKDVMGTKGETLGLFNAAMKKLYPDYCFVLKKVEYPTVGVADNWHSYEKNFEITPIHGRELQYETKKGKVLTFFVRWEDGQILNKSGEELVNAGQRVENMEMLEGMLRAEGLL